MSDRERYFAALHAVQSGVAIEMEMPERASATEPKHLRTGINAAMADIGSLARLLIAKGIFTEAEYVAALADGMEREKASYEQRLSAHFGKTIRLG